MPSTYQPLADYLAAQPGDAVTLTFAAVESLIGGSLPAAAGARVWWVSTRHRSSQVAVWRRVGWRVEAVHVGRGIETVTFVRLRPEATA